MMKRRTILKRAAGLAAGAGAFKVVTDSSRAAGVPRNRFDGMNLVIFITDQERAIQHFPAGWAARRMPGFTWLTNNGLTFTRAFTNSCMCSPARASLLTGYFPAQHEVRYTLEQDMQWPPNPQVLLSNQLANIATVMASKGYETVYKGKFHLTKPANGTTYQPSDMTPYGFSRWNPPDAGADQSAGEAGGGTADNDGRFMNSNGPVELGEEGVLAYLNQVAPTARPFCLIVSLVNPHDVLFYPRNYDDPDFGYDDSWLRGGIGLPATFAEDLSTKPQAQSDFLRVFSLNGLLPTPQMKRNYLNFYGNLMAASDQYLVKVIQTLRNRQLLDNTLIVKTSDHGEMGMAHGGMRQKCFNFYEESIRVPLVFSNPRIYKTPQVNHSLVSHADFLPTIAGLFDVPASARANWAGVDYSRLITNPGGPPVQDYTVFTYDDWQAGQATGPYVKGANHIVSFRESRLKLAEYYDPTGAVATQWEMYDLAIDPLERINLAHRIDCRSILIQRAYARMRAKLEEIKRTRLQPLN